MDRAGNAMFSGNSVDSGSGAYKNFRHDSWINSMASYSTTAPDLAPRPPMMIDDLDGDGSGMSGWIGGGVGQSASRLSSSLVGHGMQYDAGIDLQSYSTISHSAVDTGHESMLLYDRASAFHDQAEMEEMR